MAVYLPIRGLNRSSGVRVGQQKLSVDTTTYVDISDGNVRKSLAHHSTLGQYIVVGSLSATNTDVTVDSGGAVTAGSGLSVNVAAGVMRNRSTGTTVAGLSGTNVAMTTADDTLGRVDLVVWDTTTGVASVVAGVPAASPEAPTTPAGKCPLATVAVAKDAVAPGTITDVRPQS